MVRAVALVLSTSFLVQVLSQTYTCPTSTATSCISGFQASATSMAALPGGNVAPAPVNVASAGMICARYTQDCVALIARSFPGLNSANCPRGQAVTTYTALSVSDCAFTAVLLSVNQAQNVTLCGTTNCNTVMTYPPPSWVAFQNPCPTTAGSATSCYGGGIGGGALAPVAGPVAAGSICLSGTSPCSWLVATQAATAASCPTGQSVIMFYSTTVATCFQDSMYVQNLVLCNTNNCNNPATFNTSIVTVGNTSGTGTGTVIKASGAISNQLAIMPALFMALAWWQN